MGGCILTRNFAGCFWLDMDQAETIPRLYGVIISKKGLSMPLGDPDIKEKLSGIQAAVLAATKEMREITDTQTERLSNEVSGIKDAVGQLENSVLKLTIEAGHFKETMEDRHVNLEKLTLRNLQIADDQDEKLTAIKHRVDGMGTFTNATNGLLRRVKVIEDWKIQVMSTAKTLRVVYGVLLVFGGALGWGLQFLFVRAK